MNFHIKFALWLIGCISGLSLVITSATLSFWLAKEQVSNTNIGLFSLVALPYCINFIWCPILDRFKLPILGDIVGHRLGWVIFLQVILSIAVFMLGNTSPSLDLLQTAIWAFIISLISSTKDSLLGTLRSEISNLKEQGLASGIYIFGYRIGMLLGTSGAIFLSIYISWQQIYSIIAVCFLIFPFLLVLLLKNHKPSISLPTNHQLNTNLKDMFSHFGSISFIASILLFLVFYRLADNFINTMINKFLLDLKFSEVEIATTGKLCGSFGAMIGGVVGGYIMRKTNIVQSLLYFGIAHTSAHIFLMIQAIVGKNSVLYFATSMSESITGGMAMAAYIAFITSICKGRYKITQQAFFSSMMGLSRSIFPSISGIIVNSYGWSVFFASAFLVSIPSLILLFFMRNKLTKHIYNNLS
jgi:PAT family beta-lactamase induction signal transducer AmpG